MQKYKSKTPGMWGKVLSYDAVEESVDALNMGDDLDYYQNLAKEN